MVAVELWLDITCGAIFCASGFGHPVGLTNMTHPTRDPLLLWADKRQGLAGFR